MFTTDTRRNPIKPRSHENTKRLWKTENLFVTSCLRGSSILFSSPCSPCLRGVICIVLCLMSAHAEDIFNGKHFRGRGDVEYLQLLDISRRMMEPDAEFQNLSMLYNPKWNGFVEGPTWDAWWIQNSYGTTYCWLPWMCEPYVTFVQNSQDLWFDHQGDGKRADKNGYVGPDGCLVDAASPTQHYYRQGDGRHNIH